MAQEAFGVASFPGSNNKQDISKLPKMERDIIILQNVLNDLFNQGNVFYSSSRGAKGIYVPGKGVIFNLGGGNNSIVTANFLAAQQTHDEAKKEDEKSIGERNKALESKNQMLSKEFLVNYGSILSDLKSGEKVMLNVSYTILNEASDQDNNIRIQGGANVIYRGGGKLSQKRMVSSIDYATINSYLSGKSSLESAASKVSQKVIEANNNEAQDAKIMAGIMDDLFESNFDGIYRRSGKTSWTYFEGFGLMYDMNLTGARGTLRFANATNVIVTGVRSSDNDEKDTKQEEANKKVEESYDDLIELVKESLVTYGRTLRSVKSDEVVILNINFGSSFRKTKLPRAVRLQVSKSQIEAFSRGQKSLDQLKKEISITNLKASTDSFSNSHFHNDFPAAIEYESVPAASPLRQVVTKGIVDSRKKAN